MAPIVSVTFLAGGVASLGLYTYIAAVLDAAIGTADLVGHIMIWGFGGVIGSFLVGPLVDYTRRPFLLTTVIVATMVAAMFALSTLLPFNIAVLVALMAWGAAGWALTVPQQHRLIAIHPDQGAVAVAINSSALYLGSATGAGVLGLALNSGGPAGLCLHLPGP